MLETKATGNQDRPSSLVTCFFWTGPKVNMVNARAAMCLVARNDFIQSIIEADDFFFKPMVSKLI